MNRKITVWNWHGDTNSYGEPEPRIIYDGPAKQYDQGAGGKRP